MKGKRENEGNKPRKRKRKLRGNERSRIVKENRRKEKEGNKW